MDPLFQSITINKSEIKNRFYMVTMHLNMCMNYEVSDRIVEFYAARARGGCGAVCVGFCSINRIGSMPLNIGAHDDSFIPGLSKLAAGINDNGGFSIAQINHTGRNGYSMALPKGEMPVAPSAVPSRLTGDTPRELSHDEILQIIDDFAQAARRLKEAGFGGVEILCGTGYLISNFLTPFTNLREDQWGGSEENRMRFGVEVVKAVRNICGDDYPIICRLNGNDMLENGLRGEDLRRFAKALEDAGTDAFCINVGWHEARIPQITMGVPRANFAYLARGMRQNLTKPVIASHRINDVDDMRMLIEEGFCDMIGTGRGLIADPELPAKALQGREDEIVHCIACGQGCFDHVFTLQPVECMVNPQAGHEFEGEITEADEKKKVAVVGGGPAGMAAAMAAAKRGHDVTLFEKNDAVGGQLWLAGAPPGREEFIEMIDDFEIQLCVHDINIKTNIEVSAADLKEGGFDAVILATGGAPVEPPIPGADHPNVIQAWDLLEGCEAAGHDVVIVGGGAVGVESAIALAEIGAMPAETVKFLLIQRAEDPETLRELAMKGSKNVTLVEMLPKIGKDIGKSTRWTMMKDLSMYGVDVRTKQKVLEINDEGVVLETEGGTETIPADTVVLAIGTKSYNPLEEELKDSGMEVKVVGDAKKIATAFEATHSGHKAGKSL